MAKNIRVLHVDDDASLGDLVATYLEKLDDRITVVTETDAEIALNKFDAPAFDCVVSDFDMPNIDGLEFLEHVREEYPQLPFILFTGKGSEEIASQAINAGVTDYLQKGGTESYELLANRIDQAIQAYKSRRFEHRAKHDPFELVERVSDAFLALNSEFEFTYLNEAAADIFGRPVTELLGTNIWEQFPEAKETPFYDRYHEALKTGESVVIEEYFGPWDRWYREQVYPSEEGLSVIFRDITEQKEREREQQRLQERMELALERTEAVIFEVDLDTTEVQRIGNAGEFINLPADGLGTFDAFVSEIVHPDDQSMFRSAWEELFNGERDHLTIEYRTCPSNSETRWMQDDIHRLEGESRAIGLARNVTERKERERDLETAHAQLENAVEAGAVGTWEWHVQEDRLVAGRDFAKTFGVDPAEVREGVELERFTARIHEDDREEVEDRIQAALNAGGDYKAEYRVRDATGELRWVLARGQVVRDEDGTPVRFPGVLVDITERKERERRYEAIFNQTYQFTGLLEPDGTLIEANQTALDFGGLNRDEVVGKKMWDAHWFQHSEKTKGRARKAVEQAAQGEFVRHELPVQDAEGQEVIIDFSVRPVTDEDGDVVLLVPEGRDITDLKRREDELREKTRHLDAILEHTERPMFMKTKDGEYLLANRAYQELFGLEETDVIGRTDFDFHPEEMAEEVWRNDRQVFESGEAIEIEERIVVGEEERLYLSSKVPVYFDTESRRPDAVFGMATDITERKKRQKALAEANEQLEAFAGIVSHDLRNPLGVATGRLELAREECESEHLTAVSRALNRMNDLIDDLLTLSRHGEPIGDIEPIDLNDLVQGCWANVDTKDATLNWKTDAIIQADRSRLQQLLENLIRNAIEYGGDDSSITIGDLPDGFYIVDDGPGIPADERDAVFEPGHSSSEDGTGFGLSIVNEIVEAHGWNIVVTESEQGGARFEITGVKIVE